MIRAIILIPCLLMLLGCQQRTVTIELPEVPYAHTEPGDDDAS